MKDKIKQKASPTLDFVEDFEGLMKVMKKEDIKERGIMFIGTSLNTFLMYMNIMKRTKNDYPIINATMLNDINTYRNGWIDEIYCIIVTGNGKVSSYPADSKGEIFEILVRCKNINKFTIIPLVIKTSKGHHQNMLIYNPYTNDIEHFEPHGTAFGGQTSKSINKFMPKNLTTYFEDKKYKKIIGDIKYLPTTDSYPLPEGLQSMEGWNDNKTKGVVRDGKFISDPAGWCVVWSYFMVDYRLAHPKLSLTDVIHKVMKTFDNNPENMTPFIRDYSRLFIKEVNLLWDDYSKINKLDEKISDEIKKYNKYHHIPIVEVRKKIDDMNNSVFEINKKIIKHFFAEISQASGLKPVVKIPPSVKKPVVKPVKKPVVKPVKKPVVKKPVVKKPVVKKPKKKSGKLSKEDCKKWEENKKNIKDGKVININNGNEIKYTKKNGDLTKKILDINKECEKPKRVKKK